MKAYNWQGHFYLYAKYTINTLFKGKQTLKLGLRFFRNQFLQILDLEYHPQYKILPRKRKPSDSMYMFQKKKSKLNVKIGIQTNNSKYQK